MSLFKAKEWWQVDCGHGEEFDTGSICLGNVDNDPSGQVKIVTGSFQGNLRIYLPRERDYRAEDLMLEAELEAPILQLAVGRFMSDGANYLAVLHPRKLALYSIAAMGASYLQTAKVAEHSLEHTAANMCCGAFGGQQRPGGGSQQEHICVQSYDGQLSFIEGDSLSFSRFLPSFLIPGPIAYAAPSDAIVTCNAAFELQAYKYRALAAASGDKAAATTAAGAAGSQGPIAVGKRVTADWATVIGEAAVDIRTGRFSQGLQPTHCDVIVLCEHLLLVVSSASGGILMQTRLDYFPAAVTCYPVPGAPAATPGGPENLLVATHNRALFVYRGSVLAWAARVDLQPVAVHVATLGGLQGMIVLLDDRGRLLVSYLGTDPLANTIGFVETKRELDYEAMEAEHKKLAAIIKEKGAAAAAGGRRKGAAGGGNRLHLKVVAPPPSRLDGARAEAGYDLSGGFGRRGSSTGGASGDSATLTVRLSVSADCAGVLQDVALTATAPEPLSLTQPDVLLPSVSGKGAEPDIVPLVFDVPLTAGPSDSSGSGAAASSPSGWQGRLLPSSSTAVVTATHAGASGEAASCETLHFPLPLCAFLSAVAPVKSANFKIVVGTNRPPPALTQLFDDLLSVAPASVKSATAGGNALSLQYHGTDAVVTIVVSKSGGRYRLQSNYFEAMWLPLQELTRRLQSYYAEAEEGGAALPDGPFRVVYEDPLPLEDFFELLDAHFGARQQARKVGEQLEARARLFRSVQKRLLLRFRDKNPAPLNQLDALMDDTYHALADLAAAMDRSKEAIKSAGQRLGAAVQLVLQLVRFRFDLSDEEAAVLGCHLSPDVADDAQAEVGWEERTEAAMTQLLRTALAKSAKEAATSVASLAVARDTQRLKKHVSLVLERLAKGMRLTSSAAAAAAAAAAGGAGQGEGGDDGSQPGNL